MNHINPSLLNKTVKLLAKALLVTAAVSLLFLGHNLNSYAASVELELMPVTQTVEAGRSFNLDIQVKCSGQEIDGVDAHLDFNPAYLEVQSVEGGNRLEFELINTFDNSQGTIQYSAGTIKPPYPSDTFILASITFKARTVNTDVSTSISFHLEANRKTFVDYGGEGVLTRATGATVTITSNPVSPELITGIPASSGPPAPFDPPSSTTAVIHPPRETGVLPVQTGTLAPPTTATASATGMVQSTAPATKTSPVQTSIPQVTLTTASASSKPAGITTQTPPVSSTHTLTSVTAATSAVIPAELPLTTSMAASHTNWNLIIGIVGAVLLILLLILIIYWKKLKKNST